MERYTAPGLALVAILAAYWAFTIADALLREFVTSINWVDLGALFVLGLISGVALGLALGWGWRKAPRSA